MNTNGSELTLNDLGELLKKWQSADLSIPSEVEAGSDAGSSVLAYVETRLLGHLYMHRRVSFDELHSLAERAVEWQIQWARVCYGSGMEAGLGLISDADVPTYLDACSRPYARFLEELYMGPGSSAGSESALPPELLGEGLGPFIDNISFVLAHWGYNLAQARVRRYKNPRSLVAELFEESDVFVVQETECEDCPANAV